MASVIHNTILDTYSIRVSKDEANTLAVLLCAVGGAPETSPRKHVDSITKALRTAGIDYSKSPEYKLHQGHLFFGDYPVKEKFVTGKLYLANNGEVYKYVSDVYSPGGGYFQKPGAGAFSASWNVNDLPRPLKVLEPKALTAA